jgi:hypothetical protein
LVIATTGREDDRTWRDAAERNRRQVQAQAARPQTGSHDGNKLSAGDKVELIVERLDDRTIRRGTAVRPRIDPPKRVPVWVRPAGHRLVSDVVERYVRPLCQRVILRDEQDARFLVQRDHLEVFGREG